MTFLFTLDLVHIIHCTRLSHNAMSLYRSKRYSHRTAQIQAFSVHKYTIQLGQLSVNLKRRISQRVERQPVSLSSLLGKCAISVIFSLNPYTLWKYLVPITYLLNVVDSLFAIAEKLSHLCPKTFLSFWKPCLLMQRIFFPISTSWFFQFYVLFKHPRWWILYCLLSPWY